jgi:hypothetical protein
VLIVCTSICLFKAQSDAGSDAALRPRGSAAGAVRPHPPMHPPPTRLTRPIPASSSSSLAPGLRHVPRPVTPLGSLPPPEPEFPPSRRLQHPAELPPAGPPSPVPVDLEVVTEHAPWAFQGKVGGKGKGKGQGPENPGKGGQVVMSDDGGDSLCV